MKNPFIRSRALIAPAILAGFTGLWAAGCGLSTASARESTGYAAPDPKSDHSEQFAKTLPFDGEKVVQVDVKVGSLSVQAERRNSVDVKAVRKYDGTPSEEGRRLLAASRVVIERRGDNFVVKDEAAEHLFDSRNGFRNCRLEVHIRMPEDVAIKSNIGVGDSRLEGRFGEFAAKSGVGRIEVQGTVESFAAESGVGDVKAVKLDCRGATLRASSGTGNIRLALSSLPKTKIDAESGVGDVTVAMPATAKANLRMQTGIGSTRTSFGLTSRERGIGEVGGIIEGPINGGGATIRIQTGTGNASLEKLAE